MRFRLNQNNNGFPLFGNILHMVCINQSFFFIVQKSLTNRFDCSYLAYKIVKTNGIWFVPLSNLVHGQPLFPHEVQHSH